MSASKSGSNGGVWKKQTVDPACERVICPPHDPVRDFTLDPTGVYVLIRVDRAQGVIEAALCTRDHRIFAVFEGKKCQDVYGAIFEREHRSGPWFSLSQHAAYLGKELKKAETALEQGTDYWQE